MEREIKFRGKSLSDGKWYYGYFGMTEKKTCYIDVYNETPYGHTHDHIIVVPETVGQFTGLTAKNGAEIYDGDILNYGFKSNDLVKFSFHKISSPAQGGSDEYEYYGYNNISAYRGDYNKSTIVGNIHDNPTLIK